MFRRELPVYSPLPLRAVAGGVRATFTGGGAAFRRVRRSLAEEFDPEEVLLTDSGTGALTVSLRAIAAESPRPRVAMPAYGCYDLATAAVGADLQVLLYDLDPLTLSPDLDSVREALSDGAIAVVVAHLYGVPVDLSPVLELAEEAGVPVVEDAAQAAGGRYLDRPLGAFGSLAILSFGRGKGTTGCGGGALLANDGRGRAWLRRAAEALPDGGERGMDQLAGLAGQWLFGRPGLYGLASAVPFLHLGETVYRAPEPPGRMSALSAGTLRETMKLRARELERRRATARRLMELTEPTEALAPVRPPAASEPGYLRFPVLAGGPTAERLAGRGAASLGVMRGYPRPLDRLDAMRGRCLHPGRSRPGAETLARRLFTFPTHSRVGRPAYRRLEDLIREVDPAGVRGARDGAAELAGTAGSSAGPGGYPVE